MEMNEVISKCLFILGAGFSKPARCKTSSEMLDDLRFRIQSVKDNFFNNIEKEALSFLLSCLAYHCEWRSIKSSGKFKFFPNIEELILLLRRVRDRENYLPYPVTGNWADKLVQLETNYKSLATTYGLESNELFTSIENKIKKQLLKKWLQFDKADLSYLQPIKNVFQAYPHCDFCIDVCTLNHDQVLENYFNETGIWMGFSNGKWVGLESEPNLKDENRRLNLYKLHGSLNWIRDIAGDVLDKEVLRNNEDNEEMEQNNDRIINDPYIIFGQGIKTFSVEPFFSLIYHFRRLLMQKDYFFVIGYSFFDPYINNLIISSTMGTNKKIIIVNHKFGPDEFRQDNKNESLKIDGSRENKFGAFQNMNYQKLLTEYLEKIQENSFYSELPEFNINPVKQDSLYHVAWDAENFIKRYFSDKAALLIELIENFENEKKKIEHPFE